MIQISFSVLFIILGIIFILMGSIGIVRLPDFYSRSHAASKSDTLGIMFVIGGLMIYEGFSQSSLKLLFIILFIWLSNPIGSHALARAALKKGIKPVLYKRSSKKEEG
ncbi:MAG TPA: monovalent cation/H(+) antiporter subunit G [Balneolaceae bacterium]|nr:monovalent cation/H(+) antiporter subunit G [Balneolaceae bacterium]